MSEHKYRADDRTNPVRQSPTTKDNIPNRRESRRSFLKGLSATIALMLAGCEPLRYYTNAYDQKYYNDPTLRESFLFAFVETTVPGCEHDTDSIRIYTDEFYPFAEHLPYFLADLARRSMDIRGYDRFDYFTPTDRKAVVCSGLDEGCIADKLYNAAIFMAQVSVYAGIYDPNKGCALIDFPGTNPGYSRDEMCYADNKRLISIETTTDGIVD